MPDEQQLYEHVDSISHNGTVVVFGEQRSTRKLRYQVLDLEQTADAEKEGAWEDATRWTDWYDVPWPDELRPIGLSLLTVKRSVDQTHATNGGCWKVLSDGNHIYVFRALNLADGQPADAIRVYANRYTMSRQPSPDAGTNKAAKGQDIAVPQLIPAREGRYRRSAMRETPQSDTDNQGTRNLINAPFIEPTMEFSMLRPLDGLFAVTLTPSDVPDRQRWQFFCNARKPAPGNEPAIAAYSILRDESGWADLADKAEQLDTDTDPLCIAPDVVFTLPHTTRGELLKLVGRPDAITFRMQEQASGVHRDNEDRAVSPQRVILAARVRWTDPSSPTAFQERLLAIDFRLKTSGAIDVGEALPISDVDFARTALAFNSEADRVELLPSGKQQQRRRDFSVHAWVRHDGGSGTLVCRGWEPGENPVTLQKPGWAIEWHADSRQVVGVRVLNVREGNQEKTQRFEVAAPAPVPFTWHHIGLVRDADKLLLYVDGVLASETPMDANVVSHAVGGGIVAGGPISRSGRKSPPDRNWLDFRLDQLVVWNKAVVPDLDTIYVELDDAARADVDLVGCWTFDRGADQDVNVDDDAGFAASYTNHGADVVSQTAPLFPASKRIFEQHLGDMSTGMGWLAVPERKIVGDPHLFLGADGIVRLYTVAEEVVDATARRFAASLVYDTTTTRAQFSFPWQATPRGAAKSGGAKSAKGQIAEGLMILTARIAGPVMNRAQVTLEDDPKHSGKLRLTTTHPHRPELKETWSNLPKQLEALMQVLNGRASSEAEDGATHFDYAQHGPRGDKQPYPSELFQAAATLLPDNGADAIVQTGEARRRQQGNFTGWTRAPLMVSGKFGDGGSKPITAGVDLTTDAVGSLRCQGDFAVEAWIRSGTESRPQRIWNWHQAAADGASDGVSLAIAPAPSFGFPTNAAPDHLVLRETRSTPSQSTTWFRDADKPATTMLVRFQVPHGGGEGARSDLLTLICEDTLDADLEALFQHLGELHRQDIASKPDKVAQQAALTSWLSHVPVLRSLNPYFKIKSRFELRMGVRGTTVLVETSGDVQGEAAIPDAPGQPAKFFTNPFTRKDLTRAETAVFLESLVKLRDDLMAGNLVSPPGTKWSVQDAVATGQRLLKGSTRSLVEFPLVGKESEFVDVAVTLDPQESTSLRLFGTANRQPAMARINRGKADIVVNGVKSAEWQSKDVGESWIAPSATPQHARLVLGKSGQNPPFSGAIQSVTIWDRAVALATAGTAAPSFQIDLSKARPVSPAKTGQGATHFRVSGSAGGAPIEFPASHFAAAVRVAPMLGDRLYESTRAISSTDWLHLALVCTDNHAIRFRQDGDRAVIQDADELNPGQAFTIDCVLMRDFTDKTRYVYSKAIESGANKVVTVRLAIMADGTPWLRYTAQVGDRLDVRDFQGSFKLKRNHPYHLFASLELKEIFVPEKPTNDAEDKPLPRYQFWTHQEDIAVWDILANDWASRPRSASSNEAALRGAVADLSKLGLILATAGLAERGLRPLTEQLGVLSARDEKNLLYDVRVQDTSVPAAIGAASGEDDKNISGDAGWFRGLIGSVRLWSSRLSEAELTRLAKEPGQPEGMNKPTAWWRFDENKGLQASDSASGKTALLADEKMWTATRLTSRLRLYVNGRPLALQPVADFTSAPSATISAGTSAGAGKKIDYGPARRLTIGGLPTLAGTSTEKEATFDGLIDEVRVWRDLRTNEEILDNMHVRLAGNEDDLVGYWPISSGAGARLKDASGGGNHATLTVSDRSDLAEFWTSDAAPVGDDLPQVRHLLGGLASSWTAIGDLGTATSAEYGDLQTDADGNLTGVQKRALAFPRSSRVVSCTGFKTGDLDLVYVGQAQSDPTLIGYIEGAPPVPSENLTRAYWSSNFSYSAYDGNSSVAVMDAEDTLTTFQGSYDRGFDLSYFAALGIGMDIEINVGQGVAFGGFVDMETNPLKVRWNVMGQVKGDSTWSSLESKAITIGTTKSASNSLALRGRWEDAGTLLNNAVGRRYLPHNTGYALVTSGVANVFALRLRTNGALLGLRMIPDPDIPEDFNILHFKIRRDYTKQGTLDGMVGFVPDPDWPTANQRRGSYFRPIEVANLEADIEAYETRLQANYETFDAKAPAVAKQADNDDNALARVERNLELPYDWEKNLSKRNIVNTYVWTSQGGFFAEELRTTITRSESKGGANSWKLMAGVKTTGQLTAYGGMFWDASVLFGGHINSTVTKTKCEGRNFGLSANVACDSLLERFVGDEAQRYSGEDVPGKVKGYRFKSFYLVPDKKHFEHFWSIVDADWLESDDLDARALRQAKSNLNHVWRVFHRVTYVNRVPPKRKAKPEAAGALPRAAIFQDANWQNIALVEKMIRNGQDSTGKSIAGVPHRELIALAVDDLVRRQWSRSAPWWASTVAKATAATPDAQAERTFEELRRATYEYMLAYFHARPVIRAAPPDEDDETEIIIRLD